MTRKACENGDDVQRLRCSPEMRQGLRTFLDSLAGYLGEGLLGVYLYGSLANGCYNGKTSDVDVVVVLTEPIDEAAKAALLELHRQAAAAVDATYITREQLSQDCFPTPLQCVIRPVKLFTVPNGLIDFLLVRQDVYVNGCALLGPEFASLVKPVPWELTRQCALQLFPFALERFKNPILMLCRIACTLATHQPCSKAQAGRWALGNLDARWHPMISQALGDYERGAKLPDLPAEQAQAFEAYCRGREWGLEV